MASITVCKLAAVLLTTFAVTAPLCQAARLLKGGYEDIGDPSGYSAQANARSTGLAKGRGKSSLTRFSAEATANAAFPGVYRVSANIDRATYATVESDPSANPDRRKEVIKPRARSAQNVPGSVINLASGAGQVPALYMGGASVAQTYEGATSVAGTDALMVNQGKKKTAVSNSMLTASTGSLKAASAAGSYGVTAQPATALALSGTANGNIQLAQADQAVAIAQTEARTKQETKWGTTASGSLWS